MWRPIHTKKQYLIVSFLAKKGQNSRKKWPLETMPRTKIVWMLLLRKWKDGSHLSSIHPNGSSEGGIQPWPTKYPMDGFLWYYRNTECTYRLKNWIIFFHVPIIEATSSLDKIHECQRWDFLSKCTLLTNLLKKCDDWVKKWSQCNIFSQRCSKCSQNQLFHIIFITCLYCMSQRFPNREKYNPISILNFYEVLCCIHLTFFRFDGITFVLGHILKWRLYKVNHPIVVRIGVGPIVVKILIVVYIWELIQKFSPKIEIIQA